jgi:hypothetical protein
MSKVKFDRLHIASLTDGDWGMQQLEGLSRLSPLLYIGSNKLSDVTLTGYYNCPDLAHFRVAVREIRTKPDAIDNPIVGTPEENRKLACPNLFDLDTRNLYFGQLNQNPLHAKIPPGAQGTESKGGIVDGSAVKGMPVRLQQVHFRAFRPQGFTRGSDQQMVGGQTQSEFGQSDEYSAYFLVSSPVGPFGATASASSPPSPSVTINSDFALHRGESGVTSWTSNKWTLSGKYKESVNDFERRLIMGDPFRVKSEVLGYTNVTSATQRLNPNPKNNTFGMIIDEGSLVVRQRNEGKHVPGWKYATPLSFYLLNRYKFTPGQLYNKWVGTAADVWRDPNKILGDHMVMQWYQKELREGKNDERLHTDKIMRRPSPESADKANGVNYPFLGKDCFIGAGDNGWNWESVYLPQEIMKVLCSLFSRPRNDDPPRVVQRVYSNDCGIYTDYIKIHGCQTRHRSRKKQDRITWTRHTEPVILFTNCDEQACEPSWSSSSSSSSSFSLSSSSSYSSSSSSSSSSSFSSSSTSSFGGGDLDCGTKAYGEKNPGEPGRDYCPQHAPEE